MLRPSSQPNYRIASVLTRTRIGGEGQTRKNRSCDWLNEKPLALQVSAWTLSEDGDLVCSCDQTELLYHSVPFTCKVGFHSSVIVCSWYPSLDKHISHTEMNDLSVVLRELFTNERLMIPLGYVFLHVTVFRQRCLCVSRVVLSDTSYFCRLVTWIIVASQWNFLNVKCLSGLLSNHCKLTLHTEHVSLSSGY